MLAGVPVLFSWMNLNTSNTILISNHSQNLFQLYQPARNFQIIMCMVIESQNVLLQWQNDIRANRPVDLTQFVHPAYLTDIQELVWLMVNFVLMYVFLAVKISIKKFWAHEIK